MEEGTSKKGILALLLRPFRKNSLSPTEIEEEISGLLDNGALTKRSGDMIHSIFEFDDTVAKQIMTPRIDVCGVERGITIGGIIDTALQEGYSRLPVYEGDLDHIVGMVVVRDLLGYWSSDLSSPLPAEIVRPVTLVHGTKKIGDLLSELRHRKSHLAVVLDEYGGTAGLVTMEDIIEEIVGDIHDEYDTEEVEDIKELAPGIFLATGQASISDLNDRLSLDIPEGNYETLGGFLTHQLGRVPLKEEEIPFGDSLFRVKEADDRKVDQVEISPLETSSRESAGL
ncbi:MAG: hemolysin family protein [Deltaproteobacteria bacterium]|nr:hemolysin family protein [Deltaproteobacteria bacterium]